MSFKSKKKNRPKISTSEVRSPINLQQIANNQRDRLISRQDSRSIAPFIKSRGVTPIASTSQPENEFKPVVSLRKFPSFSENSKENPCFSHSKNRLPLSIDVETSLESFSNNDEAKNQFEEAELKGFSEYQNEIQRIKQEYEEKVIFHAEDTKKIIANKYKGKYKAKIQETLLKQNEIHKFQLDSLKKNYESKISKYKEIIERLHKENEELVNGRTVKHSDLINPLIEENLWLKKQLSLLKPKKKTVQNNFH